MEDLGNIQEYAKKHSVPIMRDESCQFICDYIKSHNLKKVLEIGTAIGFSSINFALAADDVYVTTIELDIDRHITAKQNIHNMNLDDRITPIYGDALVHEFNEKFDLIFIDAAKAQYIRFFEKFKNNLSEQGVIVSDNLSFHGMVEDLSLTHNYSTKKLVKKIQKYVEFLKENKEFSTEFFPYGDGISVSKKI